MTYTISPANPHQSASDLQAQLQAAGIDCVIAALEPQDAVSPLLPRQVEQALQESRARLQGIIESAMDAIISVDAQQNIVLFNTAAEQMFGITASAVIGQPLTRLIPARFHSAHQQHVGNFGQTQTTKRTMAQLGAVWGLRADGSEFPIEASISQIGTGERKLYTVILRDITLRKLNEERLRESSERLRLAVQAAQIFTWEYDIARQTYLVAENFTQVLELPPEYATHDLRQVLEQYLHPDDAPGYAAALAQASNGTAALSLDYRLRHPLTGVENWLYSTASRVCEPNHPARLIGVTQNITGRKRAEMRLAEQAELLHQAHDAIISCDLQGRVLFWNRGAERIYEASALAITGTNPRDWLYQEQTTAATQAHQLLFEQGEWKGEITQFTKTGKPLKIAAHWKLVRNPKGEPQSILIINHDVTEQKKLEQQLLRAQRLESIGTLAGGIAHDLNNVLTPVLMATQMLQLKFADDESQRWLEMMRTNIERGAEMVKQILLFARGSKGERIALQPKHLIKEIVKLLQETFPKNIHVKFSLPDEPWQISGDATQLHQVLMNLCVNARDAMPLGGTLLISTANQLLNENDLRPQRNAQPGRYVVISVSDTGTGIDPATLERIFDPFFTTKELGKGTGLGLATVQGIVKSHGGFINVYSEPGNGTKFTLYLPAESNPSAVQPAAANTPLPTGNGETILVVDDEAAVREITRNALETYGYQVFTAIDGADAVAIFATQPDKIQLVLTDMMMPRMDGPALIRALRKLAPQIRIIATSGLTEEGKAAEAQAAGVTTFLAKPYTAETLLKTLAAELRK